MKEYEKQTVMVVSFANVKNSNLMLGCSEANY